jgi:hypothetical protein
MTENSTVALTENSGKSSDRADNLKPWKPGQSGNPGGRPKKLPVTAYIVDQLEKPIPAAMRAKLPPMFRELYGDEATFGQMLAFTVISQAASGDMRAMTTVLDRAEGKVKQSLGVSGEDGNELEFRVVHIGLAERIAEARQRSQ